MTDRVPVLKPGHTYASITDQISAMVLRQPTRRGWVLLFLLFAGLSLGFLYAVTFVFTVGVGLLGINVPVAWGFPIINVVWWIGIGHAGTLISAILLLFRQPWRTSINRFAEAMTIFAAGIAALFPLIHLGRPWFFYWLLPYPDTMALWPQWRSPLVWDIFAIGTYLIVSILFWYMGLLPDLATLRDRARSRIQQVLYGLFSLGWRGSAAHWHRMETAYLLLAAFATPLVISVHSVISLDFAVSIVPGYHSTVFPPYFVAGALFSGFCMVVTIAVPLRRVFGLQDFITLRHFDMMGRIMLAAGWMVIYGYLVEVFIAWYGGSEFERAVIINRALGPYASAFWSMLGANVLVTQLLWLKSVRTQPVLLFAVALVLNVGMWLERYVIVITSIQRDFVPAIWDVSHATGWDWAILFGSLGLFFFLMLAFIRFLPAISIFEMRQLVREKGGGD
ncbi:MAG TPA: NrfD/PsrC family molybdoenzyme membrane anchor subunit [Pelomicrobium sp.]|nr:NrfD/PsrC family molybdoenzyme membrane anchor subunit [Pelomicrobium sp.]